jgi:hypothetical protein
LPKIEVRAQSRVRTECAWLSKYASNVASQCGQDGILEKMLDVIGAENRWCVEFGAWDGKYLSNTWNLISNKGWSGVMMEGSEEKYQELLHNTREYKVHSFNKYVSINGETTLDSLLSQVEIPVDFDFLSIDIDGNDWHVWQSLTDYRPRIVCIEFNPTVANEVYFVQDADPSISQGCSLLALIDLGKAKGYELAATSLWDGIFVRSELFSKFGIPDNSIDAMYTPNGWVTHLFQGYDGTFWAAGNLTVGWKGIPFQADELQVIPQSMRHYP